MKILLVKTSSLGDIVQAYPVLQYCRQYDPKAKIDWVVEEPYKDLVQTHPDIDDTLIVKTKQWRRNWLKKETWKEVREFREQLQKNRYDLVLDLQGNTKSGLITGLALSPLKIGFGYQSVAEWPNLLFTHRRFNPPPGKNKREDYLSLIQHVKTLFNFTIAPVTLKISQREQERIEQILASHRLQRGPKIMICPGSNWPNKQLPLSSLKPFLYYLHQELKGSFVFVWGTLHEKTMVEDLAHVFPEQSLVMDRLPLPTLQNLMSHMGLVLAMDSMALHLAGSAGVPTFGVFGPSRGDKYKPMGSSHEVFQGTCPYGKRFDTRCQWMRSCSTGSCINQIASEDLFLKFNKWWLDLQQVKSQSLHTPVESLVKFPLKFFV
jgi:heptosyltransferase-1